jgi:hypothetical protein
MTWVRCHRPSPASVFTNWRPRRFRQAFFWEKAKCKRLQKKLDSAYCIYYIRLQFGVFCIRIADFHVLIRGKGGAYVAKQNPVRSLELCSWGGRFAIRRWGSDCMATDIPRYSDRIGYGSQRRHCPGS